MIRVVLISLGEFVAQVVITVVVAGILQQWLQLDTYQGILSGAVLFLCLLAIQINYRLVQMAGSLRIAGSGHEILVEMRGKVRQLADAERAVEDLDQSLRQIADGIKTLVLRYGRDDVFVRWYRVKVAGLQRHLQHTLSTQSFDFDMSLLQERNSYLDSLSGRETDRGSAVSHCEGYTAFATADGTVIARDVDERLQSRNLVSIRRLFVYEDRSELETREMEVLFFLHEQSGYEYRLIRRTDLDTIYQAFGDKSLMRDFGIWGDHFVWETPPENIIGQLGEICRDEERIAAYKHLYQVLWDAARIHKVTDQEVITVCQGHRIGDFRELIGFNLA